MPVVFIHGVNTRDSGPQSKYGQLKQRIEAGLTEHVLKPLGLDLQIHWPNWGQYAVSFNWYQKGYGLVVIPTMGMLERVDAAPAQRPTDAATVEAAEAVRVDDLGLEDLSDAERERVAEALRRSLADHDIGTSVLRAESEADAATALGHAVAAQLGTASGPLERVGSGLLGQLGDRLLRVLSTVVVRRRRQAAQRNASRFMADAFVYARDRGTRENPGKIIQEVLTSLRTPRKPGEPLIVITHSMGGNILYDILTTYDPALQVDTWIAVGSQVGHFEDMKLFCASDARIQYPTRVKPLPNVKRWFNVLDKGDVIAFLAAPVFEGVDDVFYSTRESVLTAHAAYFEQDDFYKLLCQLLRDQGLSKAGEPVRTRGALALE